MARFQTQKTGALLAYCALSPQRSFAREALAELLWPNGDSTAIRNRLNQAVSSLRRQLHPPGSVPGAVLVADHYTVRVNPEAITTDVGEFTTALRNANEAQDDVDAAAFRSRAVDLYKGDFLEGYQEEWAGSERIRFRDQFLEAASWLIKYYAAQDQIDSAIDLASRRLTFDAKSEVFHRTLIRLYLKAGRAKSALAHAEQFERSLAGAGLAASPKLLELAAMARHAVGLSPNLPKAMPVDLGYAPEPTVVRETTRVVEPAPTPALPLPRYLTKFVDRDRESALVIDWLCNQDRRMITLTGMGGSGKTRLAVEVASRCVHHYQSRVFFVSFEDESGSADVLDLIAQATILSRAPSERFGEHLPSHLASLGPSLLVLDNLEYLSDRQVSQIVEVLQEAHQVQTLCTSRQPLGVDGEQILIIDPLPVPVGLVDSQDLEALAANASIMLFVQRAQLVRQDFQLTERTAGPIVDVCCKLEGIPLALELAASWARTLTPTQMLAQIDESIDNLSSRRRDTAPRHSSVSRAIDGSFALLGTVEQEAFLRLAVLAGSWDMAAAAAMCPGVDLRPVLQALEDRSLIQTTVDQTAVRYSTREILRAYAASKTPPALAEELSEIHASHFFDLARPLARGSITKKVDVMSAHRHNMAKALAWTIERGVPAAALEFANIYAAYCEYAGHLEEGIMLATQIESRFSASSEDSRDYCMIMVRKARMHDDLGQTEIADQYLAICDAFLAQHPDVNLEFEIAYRRAIRYHRTGRYEETVALVQKLCEKPPADVPSPVCARLLLVAGNSLTELGRLADAIVAYQKSLDLAELGQDTVRVASARSNMGNAYRLMGEFDTSESLLRQSRALVESLHLHARVADSGFMLAQLAVDRNRPEEALNELRTTDAMMQSDVNFTLECTLWKAYALIRLGEHELAAKMFGFAENYARQNQLTYGRIEVEKLARESQACIQVLGLERFQTLKNIGTHLTYDTIQGEVNGVQSRAALQEATS